ncbi:MAG: hypothetical protein Q4F79_08000 [Eubacteriales bacterium]|nr:hypothetical protein [Eubacteriales bacterium]
MSDCRLTLFSLPEWTGPAIEKTTECVVDATGMVFETVHMIFNRRPELFAALSEGAVLVPLFALEIAQRQNGGTEERLLSFLFSNLEYSFSQQAFTDYLSEGSELPQYTGAVGPDGSFWRAVAQGAEPEEYSRLMLALHQMLSAMDASSEDALAALCRTVNQERMHAYCWEADSAETVCKALTECYTQAMAGSGDAIPTEERDFMLHALVLYSIWELSDADSFAAAVDAVPMSLMIPIADFCAMMEHSESRESLDELFACTDVTAGSFWKTLYAAAKQSGDELLVAETAAYLEALLCLVCTSSEGLQRHRVRLFALVS